MRDKFTTMFLKKTIKQSVIVVGLWVFVAFFSLGCSTLSRPHRSTQTTHKLFAQNRLPLQEMDRTKLALIAQSALGKSKLKVGETSFRDDCSGTIRAIFAKANIGLGGIIKNYQENDVKALYRYVKKYGEITQSNPRMGDLVFFHNTYDRSRNGRMNDALTHVGIVEKVEDSTVHFIHHLGQSIIRSRMDLSRPTESFDKTTKKRINHILRKAQGSYRAYTAAELFAGFGRL